MSNPVVQVNLSIQVAPLPDLLQKTGAFISQGGTILAPGVSQLLTQPSVLTPFLVSPAAIASITYGGGNAQVSTVNPLPSGYNVNDTVNLTIAGVLPAGYNGNYPCTITSSNSFEYALPVSPGATTALGTWVNAEANSLVQRATTFFAQGAAQSVYVLELGPGTATEGVNALSAFITANPNVYYSYLVPRFWDANTALLSLIPTFEGTAAKTYFFVTTTLATYQLYAGMKSAVCLIEAPKYGAWPANAIESLSWNNGVATANTATAHGVLPGQWFQLQGNAPSGWNGWFKAQLGTTGTALIWNLGTNPGPETVLGTLVASPYASSGIGANEFSLAAPFYTTLNYAPSSSNKVTQLNFAFESGVTAFPANGNSALISTILQSNCSIISTGAAGGISATLMRGGKMMDGNPFKYWYSIDWVQINLQRNMTAVLINGANNPQNPVDYDQPGINSLQQSAVSTMNQGLSADLVLNKIQSTTLDAADLATALDLGTYDGSTLINAEPFAAYTTENPNDYAAGAYNGVSVDYTPLRGFESITVNVTVSDFVS